MKAWPLHAPKPPRAARVTARACAAVLGLLAALLIASPAQAAPRAFVAGSYAQILAEHRDRALVVVFWSLTCSHCQQELSQLAALRRDHPRVAVVLVSTDTPQDAEAIDATLRSHGLAGVPSWVFADDSPERLRHEVDRRWRGELPRTVLVAPRTPPRTVVGRLGRDEFGRWLAAHSAR